MIYICRHGQTEWNRDGRIQGQLDSPLTDDGVAEAGMLGEFFYDAIGSNRSRVYSSDLGRAVQTSDIISEALGNVIVISRTRLLRERCYGTLEGKHSNHISIPEDCNENIDLESYKDVAARIATFVPTVNHEGYDTIIVCHRSSGRILMCALNGDDWSDPDNGIRLKHDEVAIFDHEYGFQQIVNIGE